MDLEICKKCIMGAGLDFDGDEIKRLGLVHCPLKCTKNQALSVQLDSSPHVHCPYRIEHWVSAIDQGCFDEA